MSDLDQTDSQRADTVRVPDSPVVSVALLIKNGMPELAELLSRLKSQQGVPAMEIVAVDSGSVDGSLEVLRQAGARVHQIPPEQFRFGPTRQLVFSLTRGKVIVTMSQDTLPGGDGWLAAMVRPILDGQMDIVQAEEVAPEEIRPKLSLYSYTHPYQHVELPYARLSCAGVAISRSAWEQTGFGEVPMSEDKYLAVRAGRLKLRMGFCTAVPMLHGHDYSVKSLMKRAFNEGLGARPTEGRYGFTKMLSDIFRFDMLRWAGSMALKTRQLGVLEAAAYPLRPIFLYLGFRFGRRYWR